MCGIRNSVHLGVGNRVVIKLLPIIWKHYGILPVSTKKNRKYSVLSCFQHKIYFRFYRYLFLKVFWLYS